MAVAGHRHERLAEEILHEVSSMLAGELKDPRLAGILTVTEVRVSPDLKHARIFVSVTGSEAERASTLAGLAAAAGYVRHQLTERLRLRRGPEVHFLLDRSEEYGQHIEELLRQTKQSDKPSD
jgi:ribosome-binding factor A